MNSEFKCNSEKSPIGAYIASLILYPDGVEEDGNKFGLLIRANEDLLNMDTYLVQDLILNELEGNDGFDWVTQNPDVGYQIKLIGSIASNEELEILERMPHYSLVFSSLANQ